VQTAGKKKKEASSTGSRSNTHFRVQRGLPATKAYFKVRAQHSFAWMERALYLCGDARSQMPHLGCDTFVETWLGWAGERKGGGGRGM